MGKSENFEKSNKKIICVWGNNGAGKSTFTVQTSLLMAQNTSENVLVIDFNTLNPALDHYFGIPKQPSDISYKIDQKQEDVYNTSLNYAYDAIERKIFDQNILKEIIVEHPKYKNLHILTGNYLLNVFEMLNTNHFINIIEAAKKIYDILIIDINSVMFVDATYVSLNNADIIYLLTEADYTSLRELNKSINYVKELISNKQMKVVINKYTKKHLDKTTVEQILSGKNVAGYIDYSDKYITCKIDKNPYILSCKTKEKQQYLKIIKDILN